MLGAAAFVAGNPTWSTQLADAAELAVVAGRAPLELEIRSWLAWSLACNGQAADADVHLARCAHLGASDSIHAHQCATAAHIASTWRGRPTESTQFGAILPGSTDPFMSFASALRCMYTGDATGLDQVWDDDDRSPIATSMRSIQAALRILLIDDDPVGAANEIEPVAEEPWLGRPVFPVVWLAATLALAAGHTATARSLADTAESVAAPAGWGQVGVAMLRSELALDDGDLAVAERAALDGLAVAVRQDLRPWICDLVEQIAFIDVTAGRAERAIVLARATARPGRQRAISIGWHTAGRAGTPTSHHSKGAKRGRMRPSTSTAWPSGSCARAVSGPEPAPAGTL